MRQFVFLILFLSLLGSSEVARADYDAVTGETAYSIVLWQNGDPTTETIVTGKYADLNADGKAEHDKCRVTATRTNKPDGTHWTIRVIPKEGWGVAEVHYPMLILPLLEDDYLLVGKRIGQRWPMSFTQRNGEHLPAWSFHEDKQGVTDLFNKTGIFWSRYPSSDLTMQMIGYENDRQGVLLWTPDSDVYVKDFVVSREDLDESWLGQGYRAYVVHFPENTGQPGTGFDSPYPVVTTPYTGGWQGAADIYRKWARKQWWCAQGKLYERKTTPDWYKDVHLWYGISGRPGWARQWLLKMRDYVGQRPFGAQYMNWAVHFQSSILSSPDYRAAWQPDSFHANLTLRGQGIYLSVYTLLGYANTQHQSIMDIVGDSRQRNADGSYAFRHYPIDESLLLKRKLDEIVPGLLRLAKRAKVFQEELRVAWTKPVDEKLIAQLDTFPMADSIRTGQKQQLRRNWGKDAKVIDRLRFFTRIERLNLAHQPYQDYCVGMISNLVQSYDVPSVYFDTFPHTTLPNFDKSHGHPVGYGRWKAQADRAILVELQKRHPSLVFVCESGGGEHLLDLMHMTYHKGVVPIYSVPLFSAVYHGYCDFTSWWMWPPYKTNEDYTSMFARGQHLGYMPGSAVSGGVLAQFTRQLNLPPDDPKMKFTLAAVDLRSKYRAYLAAGDRLRDPDVVGPAPQTYSWAVKSGKVFNDIEMSPVQASKWAHYQDASRAILLISNASGQQQQAVVDGVKLDLPGYSWRAIEVEVADP